MGRRFGVLNGPKKDNTLSLRIPSGLKRRLRAMSRKRQRTVNWLVQSYVETGLTDDEAAIDLCPNVVRDGIENGVK